MARRWTLTGYTRLHDQEIVAGPELAPGERVDVVEASEADRLREAIREHVDTVMPRDGTLVDMADVAIACERLWAALSSNKEKRTRDDETKEEP